MPASSACIERFFSIFGVICSKRMGNKSEELIIEEAFVKVNLKLLQDMKKLDS